MFQLLNVADIFNTVMPSRYYTAGYDILTLKNQWYFLITFESGGGRGFFEQKIIYFKVRTALPHPSCPSPAS